MRGKTIDIASTVEYKSLERLLGRGGPEKLMAQFRELYPTTPDFAILDLFNREVTRARQATFHFIDFSRTDRGPRSRTENGSAQHDPNALALAAAQWIKSASNSGTLPAEAIAGILRRCVDSACSLVAMRTIVDLHKQLVPMLTCTTRRISNSGSLLTSSDVGMALLRETLLYQGGRAGTGERLARRLFAWLVRFHPFPDGNGRTARAAYAIALLREGWFEPLAKADENRLTGLPVG